MARRPSSVCLSVNFCANRFFSQANGRIATKLSQDGLQVSVHPGCAQGQGQSQGQRSRDTRTFLDSWNELLRHWRSGSFVESKRCIVRAWNLAGVRNRVAKVHASLWCLLFVRGCSSILACCLAYNSPNTQAVSALASSYERIPTSMWPRYLNVTDRRTDRQLAIGVWAQSTFGGKTFLPEDLCMKN